MEALPADEDAPQTGPDEPPLPAKPTAQALPDNASDDPQSGLDFLRATGALVTPEPPRSTVHDSATRVTPTPFDSPHHVAFTLPPAVASCNKDPPPPSPSPTPSTVRMFFLLQLGFTGSFPPGTQWSLRRPVYGLRQAPREWHDTLRTTLATLGFAPSTADPSLFLRTDTSLPPFYILVYVDDLVLQRFDFTYSSPQATPLSTRHSLSALPSDESVEPSGPYPELVGCLMYLMTCTRPDLAYPLSILARYVAPGRHRPEHMAAAKRVLRYLCSTSALGLVLGGRRPVVLTGHADASWADDQATQRSSQGYTFSLGSGSVSWRSTRSSSVLGSSCEAEIYAGAMAAQELRWLTYMLTDLGEQPRSPPVLYVDNKAMLALCREHRLEHRTKHIALRYFLARELQQRGQLRLAYVASEANTADIFTKALPPGDHQRFCTMLGFSYLTHEHTDAHKAAVDRQLKLAAGIREGQQAIFDFINSDVEGRRGIRLMRSTQFLCQCNAPLSMFPKLMRHLAEQDTPDISRQSYSVYGFQQMVHSISTYLTRVQMDHILASPFLGIQCDESTDRTPGKHMIVYLTFFKNRQIACEFFTLLTVEWCDAGSLFEVLLNHLRSATVDVSKIVSISTDGASVMTGKENGLVACLREHVLGACIVLLWEHNHKAYEIVTCYKFQFCLFFLADILADMNDLNRCFQRRETTMGDLTERYFGGEGKSWLVNFLKVHKEGGGKQVRVRGVDGEGRPINHLYTMHERKLKGHKQGSTYADCVKLCRQFARDCVDNLNEQLDDLGKLGPTKLFRAGKWPKIKAQREKKCKEWLHGCSRLFRGIRPQSSREGAPDILRWPNLILLWQALAVLPLSTVECERGFSRQNIIKSWVRGALCNARLGELMQISLLKYEIEWPEALEVWRSMRRRRPVKSLKLAVAERERKGKQKEGEAVAAGTAGENEDEGEEEEDDDEVEQDLGDDQEVVEEEDNPFLSDDEDVEEVYFIDKPVH
ncbi:unnamed protein product [Closterium sp. NIES-54]